MNLKPSIFHLFIVFMTAFFSACATAEREVSDEIVIEDKTKTINGEVYITNANLTDDKPQTTTQPVSRGAKITLSDKSEIETLTDGFGNKTETRYFSDHPRLRFVVLRTSVDGKREVTVHGRGGDTKVVAELAENALTASADKIAAVARLNAASGYLAGKNYMKRRNTESPASLKPLPGSSFQPPAPPVNESLEKIQSAETKSEN